MAERLPCRYLVTNEIPGPAPKVGLVEFCARKDSNVFLGEADVNLLHRSLHALYKRSWTHTFQKSDIAITVATEPNRTIDDKLCCLIYISTATAPLSWDDIRDIESVSERNNGNCNVTGLLLYSGSHFIQILEGEPEAIDDVFFSKISKDSRHNNLVKLVHEPIETREFGAWSMAARSVEQGTLASVAEFSKYESAADSFSPSSRMGVRMRKLLSTFRLAN